VPTRARSTSYSALLRGINLGSHKRVRMADLRELAEDLGCADVRTYVQSGNVVFRSDRSAADLTKAIEKGIEKQLGLDVIVVIRTERQLRNLVANNPFVRAKIRPNTLYVAFLAEKPDPKRLRQLGDRDFVPERWEMVAGDISLEIRRRRPPPSACADRVCLPRVAPRAGAGGEQPAGGSREPGEITVRSRHEHGPFETADDRLRFLVDSSGEVERSFPDVLGVELGCRVAALSVDRIERTPEPDRVAVDQASPSSPLPLKW
jgi:uncharacterized protein (DUF1697 family)